MRYRCLTDAEVLRAAEGDPRYQKDALFTELVWRLANPPADTTAARPTRSDIGARWDALEVDCVR